MEEKESSNQPPGAQWSPTTLRIESAHAASPHAPEE